MTIHYTRAGMMSKASMPFVKTYAYRGASVSFDVSPASVPNIKGRRVGAVSADMATTPATGNYLAITRDPISPLIFDIRIVDPAEALVGNLPPSQTSDQTLISEMIRDQLAELQLTTLSYDALPDPGSFLSSMTDYL